MLKIQTIPMADLEMNIGQIPEIPMNPRQWARSEVDKLAKSLRETPELFEARPLLVYPHGGKYVILGGNLRYEASKANKAAEVPAIVFPAETPADKLKEIVIKDNGAFGSWDFDALANEWDDLPLGDWGVPSWHLPTEGEEGGGYKLDDSLAGKLVDRFIVPPFSVLDTKKDYWKERKEYWLEKTGDLSLTRDGKYGTIGGGREDLMNNINGGTSNFDPVLAELIMKWFGRPGAAILDPFAGEQTKGVVAGELGYEYHAVDIRSEQVAVDREATAPYKNIHYYVGDSNDIAKLVQRRDFDLCFTSPPYYDLEVYSKDDLSALGTYEEFMAQYKNIFAQCYAMLRDDAFLVVKVGEIRNRADGEYRNFVGDNIAVMREIGFKYYNEIILYQSIGTAAIRANRAMRNRKMVKVHQNVLVFYKGDLRNISKNFPAMDYRGEEYSQYFEADDEGND